jgi:ATP-dependent Clp protease adaptor protein ClpS
MLKNSIDIEELIEEQVDTKKDNQNNLVLFNDNINSFDHVIFCLTMICDHNPVQAHQCALIAHNNGKCIIKTGNYLKLEKMMYDLIDSNLTVEIQ